MGHDMSSNKLAREALRHYTSEVGPLLCRQEFFAMLMGAADGPLRESFILQKRVMTHAAAYRIACCNNSGSPDLD